MLIVLTSIAERKEAEDLAESIVEKRLAGCVQILPKVSSIYFWDGRLSGDEEHLLLIKTLEDKFDELSAFIRENHSYEIPEIVALRAEKMSESYLGWMTDYLA